MCWFWGPSSSFCLMLGEKMTSPAALTLVLFLRPPDDGACEDCHPSCGSCDGGGKDQCTNCEKGPFHVPAVPLPLSRGVTRSLFLPLPGRFLTGQRTCASKCPAGSFASGAGRACEACPPGCSQCVDSRSCVRCQGGRDPPLFLQDGRCVSECVG